LGKPLDATDGQQSFPMYLKQERTTPADRKSRICAPRRSGTMHLIGHLWNTSPHWLDQSSERLRNPDPDTRIVCRSSRFGMHVRDARKPGTFCVTDAHQVQVALTPSHESVSSVLSIVTCGSQSMRYHAADTRPRRAMRRINPRAGCEIPLDFRTRSLMQLFVVTASMAVVLQPCIDHGQALAAYLHAIRDGGHCGVRGAT
jgi:hypothetical protein